MRGLRALAPLASRAAVGSRATLSSGYGGGSTFEAGAGLGSRLGPLQRQANAVASASHRTLLGHPQVQHEHESSGAQFPGGVGGAHGMVGPRPWVLQPPQPLGSHQGGQRSQFHQAQARSLSVPGASWLGLGGKKDEPAAAETVAPADAPVDAATAADMTAALQTTEATLEATAPVVADLASLSTWPNIQGMMYLVDSAHELSGAPWWMTIIGLTLALRTTLFPIFVMTAKNTARLTLARPEMEARQKDMNEQLALHQNDTAKLTEIQTNYTSEMWKIYAKHNCNPVKSFLPMILQGFFFISFFFSLNNMCDSLPSFTTEGPPIGSYVDLSTTDPTLVMPLMTSALFLTSVELNAAEGMEGNPMMGQMKWGLRALAVGLVPLTMHMSKGVFVYWITNNAFTLVQGLALKQKPVKKILGIPDTAHLMKAAATKAGGHPTDQVAGTKPAVLLGHDPRRAAKDEFLGAVKKATTKPKKKKK